MCISGMSLPVPVRKSSSGITKHRRVGSADFISVPYYLATERLKHHEKVASAPRGRIPKGLSAKQRMARKLRTKKGRATYAKRKGMIEPIFGQLKQVLGFRQFSLRGLASMRGEWRLMATVHNLLKLWRHDQRVEMAG
jgi:hypothetical protein